MNFLMLTGTNSGNARTRTLSSLLTGSSGVEVTLVGTTLDAHFAPGAGLVPFASDRWFNFNGFTLHYNNAGTDFATFSNTAIGLNNGAANLGTTTIGSTNAASGAVTIQSNGADVSINTVNGAGSDLVLNGIESPAFAGNVLWLTGANEVRQTTPGLLAEQGITWQLEGTGTARRFVLVHVLRMVLEPTHFLKTA
jgi:hypothetical protein